MVRITNQCGATNVAYTIQRTNSATELTLHFVQRKFLEGLLQGQQTGHQLPSVAETYRQWHNEGMFCYKLLTIANILLNLLLFC